MLELRDYQRESVDSIFDYLRSTKGKPNKNPLLQIPTGGGKSLIQAEVIKKFISLYSDVRILCLCHSTEIIKQNYTEYVEYSRSGNAGIFCGKLKRKDSSQILFSSIQSIAKSEIYSSRIDIIIIDEAHLCSNKSQGQYRDFIDKAIKFNPRIRVIGMTATPWRMDNGCLIQGETALFSAICYRVGIRDLIDRGMLTIIQTPSSSSIVTIDYSGLKMSKIKNDYTFSSMDDALSKSLDDVIPDVLSRLQDRKHVLVFCPTINICSQVLDRLTLLGQSCEKFIGETAEKNRGSIKKRFESGETKFLVSVDALTTGFNAKCVDGIVCLRPTQSSSLWIQILGRGMRVFPGKEDCLLLDYGENISRHGSLENIEAPPQKATKGGKGGEMIYVKSCPDCEQDIHMSSKECPLCGYKYPVIERRFSKIEENKDVLFDGSNQKKNDYIYHVKDIEFVNHSGKNGSFIRLKIYTKSKPFYTAYFIGNKKFDQMFIRLYEKGIFRPSGSSCDFEEGIKIIAEASGMVSKKDLPGICDHALSHKHLLMPSKVKVNYSGKYPSVEEIIYE